MLGYYAALAMSTANISLPHSDPGSATDLDGDPNFG